MSSETTSPLPPVDWSAFAGIAQPGCTQVPDEVLDWIMAYLTGAELKVLLDIVRRTFGFKKDADAISLDQLCHGIVRHDGRRLDLGSGLKRPTVLEALRSLRARQLIVAQQRVDPQTGSRPTVYALRLCPMVPREPPVAVGGGMPEHTPEYAAGDAPRPRGVRPGMPPGLAGQTHKKQGRQETEYKMTVAREPSAWKRKPDGEVAGSASAEAAVWQAVLDDLRATMLPETYAYFLAPTRVLAAGGTVLRVGVADPFLRDWLDYKLRHRVEGSLRRVGHAGVRMEFVVEGRA
jgi:hypothetical protein